MGLFLPQAQDPEDKDVLVWQLKLIARVEINLSLIPASNWNLWMSPAPGPQTQVLYRKQKLISSQ